MSENNGLSKLNHFFKKITFDYMLIGIQIVAFAIFMYITFGFVVARGVCCGDDGFHAHVAKNLADGLGYSSTLPLSQAHYTITPFDPQLGTGPTIILPTAIMIKLFGNTFWAPGLTELLLWGSALFLIGFVINRLFTNRVGITIAVLVFLFLIYTFMAYQYEMWYGLYGEIPAGMMIILGIFLYFYRNSKVSLVIIGLLFSFAYLSKLISLMPISIFIAFIALYRIFENKKAWKSSIKPILQTYLFIALGFGIPIFLFETWKLIALRPSGYFHYWKNYLRYVLDFGANIDLNFSQLISERITFARQRFGVFLPILPFYFLIIGYIIRKQKKMFSIYLIFLCIILVYFTYWIFFSLGWARYLLVPMVMTILVLTFPLIANDIHKSQKIIYILLLACLSIYNIKSIKVNYQLMMFDLYQPSKERIAQQEVADILSAELDKRPFYTQWWANAVDLEYIMKSHLNFQTIWDPALDFTKPIIVVVNNKMLYEEVPGLTDLLSKCKTETIVNYTYAECPALNSP